MMQLVDKSSLSLRFVVVTVISLTLFCLIYVRDKSSHESFDSKFGYLRRLAINWGNTFPGVKSDLYQSNCLWAGYAICCAALDDPDDGVIESERVFNITLQTPHRHSKVEFRGCVLNKIYHSSPYEMKHYNLSFEIGKKLEEKDRHAAYMDILYSDEEINASKTWLERVKVHGSAEGLPVIVDADYQYMSRFEVIKTCTYTGAAHSDQHEGGRHHPHVIKNATHTTITQTWTEWIEPLTIHGRHPFGFSICGAEYRRKNIPMVSLLSTDYILLQGTASQYNHSIPYKGQQLGRPVRHYMLDAGTSTFDSSLYNFICAYLQRGLSFDQLFGWEMTLLEPTNFWSKVPPRYKSKYHFFNAPAHMNSTDPDSPLHLLRKTATVDDFVSFKLDIDTPEIEIPMVLQILNSPRLASLIDEFFFELHFRCEIMMHCGWLDKMPAESHGLTLDRPHALELFRNMRQLGIRAHFWP